MMTEVPRVPRLRELRIASALSQRELADAAGVNKDTIRRLESTGASAQFDTLRRLAIALGCQPKDLLAQSTDARDA
jgi:DNA-binding Xre family transcriptional regulator